MAAGSKGRGGRGLRGGRGRAGRAAACVRPRRCSPAAQLPRLHPHFRGRITSVFFCCWPGAVGPLLGATTMEPAFLGTGGPPPIPLAWADMGGAQCCLGAAEDCGAPHRRPRGVTAA